MSGRADTSFTRVSITDVLSVEKTQEKRDERRTDGEEGGGERAREKTRGLEEAEDMSYFDIPTATAILAYEFPF